MSYCGRLVKYKTGKEGKKERRISPEMAAQLGWRRRPSGLDHRAAPVTLTRTLVESKDKEQPN